MNDDVGDMPIDIFGDYVSDYLGEEWTWEYFHPAVNGISFMHGLNTNLLNLDRGNGYYYDRGDNYGRALFGYGNGFCIMKNLHLVYGNGFNNQLGLDENLE